MAAISEDAAAKASRSVPHAEVPQRIPHADPRAPRSADEPLEALHPTPRHQEPHGEGPRARFEGPIHTPPFSTVIPKPPSSLQPSSSSKPFTKRGAEAEALREELRRLVYPPTPRTLTVEEQLARINGAIDDLKGASSVGDLARLATLYELRAAATRRLVPRSESEVAVVNLLETAKDFRQAYGRDPSAAELTSLIAEAERNPTGQVSVVPLL